MSYVGRPHLSAPLHKTPTVHGALTENAPPQVAAVQALRDRDGGAAPDAAQAEDDHRGGQGAEAPHEP